MIIASNKSKIGELKHNERGVLELLKGTEQNVSLFRLRQNFVVDISSELRNLEDRGMIEINRKISGGVSLATVSITEIGRKAIPAN